MSPQTSGSMVERKAAEATKLEAFHGINLLHIRSEVTEALSNFGKFGFMEEYTKHDISHVDSMLHIIDWLIDDETRAIMTGGDWLMTCLATYFHDFALLVTRDEYEQRSTTDFPEFKEQTLRATEADKQNYAAQIALMDNTDAERFLYGEFVRHNHAQRIRSWLTPLPDQALGFDPKLTERLARLLDGADDTFIEDLGLICESHHLDDLADTQKYLVSKPYGPDKQEAANLQFAAVLLRTADLLHIYKNRVPSMSALIVNPRNPVSQVEWAKQAKVRNVRPKTPVATPAGGTPPEVGVIEVHADVSRSDAYFGLTSYLHYTADQLRKSRGWVEESRKNQGAPHVFPWWRIDDSAVQARGFVAKTFEFSIDQGKILDLLTGHTLYNDTGVVARELVQNALDAVRLQAHVSQSNFEPLIEVDWHEDERRLTVADNGTGMSGRVIEENFLRVGASRYQDPDFIKKFSDFTSISRFGIGVLSAFMVADDVTVITSSAEEAEVRRIDLRDVHGKYLVRLLDRQSPEVPETIRSHGTSVSLRLRPSARLDDIEALLSKWIVLPGCRVVLRTSPDRETLIGAESIAEALEKTLLADDTIRTTTTGFVTSTGGEVEIRCATPASGVQIAYAVEYSRWLQEWNFIGGSERADDSDKRTHFGICVSGVRVTSAPAGYQEGGPAVMVNAAGPTAPRTNVARSALENTPEYENLLRLIYGVLAGHVTDEMKNLEDTRSSSSTRAAQEASWMVGHLAGERGGVPASTRVLTQALREVPAIVVERKGLRGRQSIDDLKMHDQCVMVEGGEFSSLESVLRSVRGASKASLGGLMSSLGISDSLALPEGALICGLTPMSFFDDLFKGDWEVAQLATDSERRTLTVLWKRIKDQAQARWRKSPDVDLIPRPLYAVSEQLLREVYSRRRSPGAMLATDAVKLNGVTEPVVAFRGSLLAMPGFSLLDIQATDQSPTAVATRDWLISTLVEVAYGRSGRSLVGTTRDDSARLRAIREVLRFMEERGVYDLVDRESIDASVDAATWDVLDVERWGSRGDTALSMGLF